MTHTPLHFEETGHGRKPPLVFLHGFMGSGRSLRPVMSLLAPDRRCVAFDLPGHGRSRFGESARLQALRTLDDVARLLLEELRRLGIDRFSLYGYSMGGRLAQAVTLLEPDRVVRLILESASFGIADPTLRAERRLRDRELLAGIETEADFAAFLARWYGLPLFCTLAGTPLLQQILRERMGNSVRELRRALDLLGVGNHPPFLERLARLALPIDYFCGERDEAYRRAACGLRPRPPGLEIREFPGASHNIHSQFPQAVAEAVAGILSTGRGEPRTGPA